MKHIVGEYAEVLKKAIQSQFQGTLKNNMLTRAVTTARAMRMSDTRIADEIEYYGMSAFMEQYGK
jgi:hypothetical protein